MAQNKAGVNKHMFILIIILNNIALILSQPTDLGRFAVVSKMDIAGLLNKLCGNDPKSSDTLPSCECLDQFTVTNSIHIGSRRGTLDADDYFREIIGYGDFFGKIYQKPKEAYLDMIGVTKVSGLDCINDNGTADNLGPIYSYFFYYRFATYSPKNNFVTTEGMPNALYLRGVKYLQDMNEEHPLDIKSGVINLNETQIHNFRNLGTACKPKYPPRTLEYAMWSFVNMLALNQTGNCNMPKDSYSLIQRTAPIALTLSKPLLCGDYKVVIEYGGPRSKPIKFIIHFDLPIKTFCESLELDESQQT